MPMLLVTGDFVCTDQYVVNTPGRLLLGCGRKAQHNQFHGGTLFHDAVTGIIWAENQVSWSLKNSDG